ncbi:MAG: hypothetical protein KIT20_02045 [Alphaproteobacteria bacterium]|nr:hypothetical protein [Alphaproteobacteria bacterium]
MLFLLVPKAAGAPIRRVMLVGEDLWSDLESPEGDAEWEERIGKLRADLEVFVTEEKIVPRYLFLLYPAGDAVWEIRSVRDRPSLRVLGLFAAKDIFVSTNHARREDLGNWQSREWKAVKRLARAVWRKLFQGYEPIVTTNANEVCSGVADELFYRERS